jgi:protein O-mannosyl-transferase
MRTYQRELWISLTVTAITLLVFGWTCANDFVNYDDNFYVTDNPEVQAGLTRQSIGWAFTTFHAGNWHPLTWLSLQLDFQVYGPRPWGFHLTNALLHIANSLLLYWALRLLTGTIWESGLVAALFAVHPLHVESVAWVAERKDVLSSFFWMLTLGAYALYSIRGPAHPNSGRRWMYYVFALTAFGLGLLAKPMLVTLPFVLLLLDYWPINRFSPEQTFSSPQTSPRRKREEPEPSLALRAGMQVRLPAGSRLTFLLIEKLPFFLLAAGSCLITWHAQQQVAIRSLEDYPFTTRLANALVSYCGYLGQTIWPVDLGVFYPHPAGIFMITSSTGIAPWKIIAASAFLALVSILAIAGRRAMPYLFSGWYWYVGTLVPVIGLVQLGGLARADRYTYIPLIGIFIAGVWYGAELARRWRCERAAFYGSAVLICILSFVSLDQVRYWKDSRTLWEHTLKACGESTVAHTNLAVVYLNRFDRGGGAANLDQSAYHYREAIRLDPGNAHAYSQLAAVLSKQGKEGEAIEKLLEAVRLKPDWDLPHYNLGVAFTEQKEPQNAIREYKEALGLNPRLKSAHYNLALLLMTDRNWKVAEFHFREAERFDLAEKAAQAALDAAKAEGNRDLAEEIQKRIQHYRETKPDHLR